MYDSEDRFADSSNTRGSMNEIRLLLKFSDISRCRLINTPSCHQPNSQHCICNVNTRVLRTITTTVTKINLKLETKASSPAGQCIPAMQDRQNIVTRIRCFR